MTTSPPNFGGKSGAASYSVSYSPSPKVGRGGWGVREILLQLKFLAFNFILINTQTLSWVSLPQLNLSFYFLSEDKVRYAVANVPYAIGDRNSSCPKDTETLINLMLRDLPSYANRVTQRSRLRGRSVEVYGYFIVAGRAEFAPLTLGPGEYEPTTSQGEDNIEQIFFTTLQRRYTTTKAVQIQDYHWLFLTKSESGWRLAMMYSATGPYPAGRPPTAPRESSNGVVGQAIELWLRDCRAGVVRF